MLNVFNLRVLSFWNSIMLALHSHLNTGVSHHCPDFAAPCTHLDTVVVVHSDRMSHRYYLNCCLHPSSLYTASMRRLLNANKLLKHTKRKKRNTLEYKKSKFSDKWIVITNLRVEYKWLIFFPTLQYQSLEAKWKETIQQIRKGIIRWIAAQFLAIKRLACSFFHVELVFARKRKMVSERFTFSSQEKFLEAQLLTCKMPYKKQPDVMRLVTNVDLSERKR